MPYDTEDQYKDASVYDLITITVDDEIITEPITVAPSNSSSNTHREL